jgi:hypothetical protein
MSDDRNETSSIDWLPPWQPAGSGLEQELAREVGPRHALYQCQATPIGRRLDNDDVLFYLPKHVPGWAVVHLTWTVFTETAPDWPATRFYSSLAEWQESCMRPDHLEYATPR